MLSRLVDLMLKSRLFAEQLNGMVVTLRLLLGELADVLSITESSTLSLLPLPPLFELELGLLFNELFNVDFGFSRLVFSGLLFALLLMFELLVCAPTLGRRNEIFRVSCAVKFKSSSGMFWFTEAAINNEEFSSLVMLM